MHIRSAILSLLIGLALASCNFPAAGTSALVTPSGPQTDTIRPASIQTEAPPSNSPEPASTPTPTPSTAPKAGPIAHLQEGTALAISYIDMIDSEQGWSIGGAADSQLQDHVFRTGDGGSAWRDVTPPENTVVQPAADRIAVGAFWDSTTALVSYYSSNLLPPPDPPAVWKTTDGGDSWTPGAPLDLTGWAGKYRVSDVFFINLNTAWILIHEGEAPASDRIALFQTVNGGSTWDRVVDPSADSPLQECEKTGILFTGPWNGWMTGDCHGNRAGTFLFQTFDGGKNWIEAKLPSPAAPPGLFTSSDFACRIRPPVFFAQHTQLLLAVECSSKTEPKTAAYLYSSELDGSNWHILDYPGGQLVIRSPGDGRVFRGDVGSGLAVGEDMYIYNGLTGVWEKINSVDWTGQFDFIDWNVGWAAARRGETPLLMFTKDGGRSWTAKTPIVTAGN
jgi:photosystem II stability/assembly factor-like uncharacterized protein